MASCSEIYNALRTSIPQSFACKQTDAGLRLRTVFEHPDGDMVDLYVIEESGKTWLTDHGEALRHLDSMGFDPSNSPRKRSILAQMLSNLNVRESQGRLYVGVDPSNPVDVATKLFRLAQAVTRAGSLVLLSRETNPRFFHDDMREFFIEQHVPVIENPTRIGGSGQNYSFDFEVPRERTPLLIRALSTGSRSVVESVVNKAVRELFDVSRGAANDTRLVVLDDSNDVWTNEHVRLLEGLASVYYWSSGREILDLAGAA